MKQKDTHGFLNEIENLNNVRLLLRTIYMYGAYSDCDLTKSNKYSFKERTLKDYLKRFDNYFNANEFSEDKIYSYHVNSHRKTDKRIKHIMLDPYKNNINLLISLYHQHTISGSDMVMYLYFLYVVMLSIVEKEFSDELSESYDLTYELSSFNRDNFSCKNLESAINALFDDNACKLNNGYDDFDRFTSYQIKAKVPILKDLGLICDNSDDSYHIPASLFTNEILGSDDTFLENMYKLKSAVSFFFHYSPIATPGYLLYEKIEQLIKTEFSSYVKPSDYYRPTFSSSFIVEKTRFQNILDDEISLSLLDCIKKEKCIITYYQTGEINQKTKFYLLPVKFVVDEIYGRQYIFGWHFDKPGAHKGRFELLRIDRILSLESTKELATLSASEASSKYEEWMEEAWNTSGNLNRPQIIKIKFAFNNSPYDKYMEKRLFLYCQKGRLDCDNLHPHTYYFTVSVKDPDEMIPWINSFGKAATVLSEYNVKFAERFNNSKTEIISKYDNKTT